MSRWKVNRSTTTPISADTGTLSPPSKQKSGVEEEKDFHTAEQEDDDIHSASFNTYLLFPKESPSKESLFPTSRKKFLVMTCKRTLFACRGLLLFCFVVFLIITLVSSLKSDSGTENDTSTAAASNSPLISSANNNNNSKFHRLEAILLPPLISGNGNLSELTVSYNSNCGYRTADYAVVANALRKGLEFYEANVENITVLDAALGTKIASEQLVHIHHQKNLPLILKTFAQDLEKKALQLTEQITNTVIRASNGSESLKITLPWIETEGLWNLPFSGQWYPVGQLKSYNPPDEGSFEDLWHISSTKEVIDESESDACIYQVFHCDVSNITEKCRKVFLDVERSMYSLTHQVIYMLLAKKNKCYEKSSWKQVPSLANKGDLFLEKLCGKVWQEANSIAEASYPPKFRDLFTEQVGMCALAGYSDFLRRDWLRRIISWQFLTASGSGCFGSGERRRRLPTIGMLLREYQNKQNRHHLKHHSLVASSNYQKYGNGKRHKRSDVVLDSGNDWEKCSVHFTSVGITALSLHLRYFYDTCLDAY